MSEDLTPANSSCESESPAEQDSALPGSKTAAAIDPRLDVQLIVDRAINLSQQQCGIPVVKRLTLTSRHSTLIENVKVRVEIEDEVADAFETTVDRIAPGLTITIPDVELLLKPSVLRERTERESTRIVVTAEGVALDPPPGSPEADDVMPGGAFVVRKVEPVDILAWNEWGGFGGLTEILATFVQPNDPFVAKILQSARAPLVARVGDDAFDGYQAKNPDRVINMVGAIFTGAAAFGIGYLTTAASFEENGQKIRLPQTLERDLQGNCLDLTLLLAAACEQAGLHPLLVLIEGHIVLGVWTSEECFGEATVDVASRVLNRAANKEIILVESTTLTKGQQADFAEAIRAGEERVHENQSSMVAIDVHQARKLRFLPLASRLEDRVDGGGAADPSRNGSQAGVQGASTVAVPTITAIEDAAEREAPKTRVDRWKSKLLDLTLRNRLLNFKAGKKTLEFLVSDVGRLEDLLQSEKKFRVAPLPDMLKGVRDLSALRRREGIDVADAPLKEALEARTLCAPQTVEEIEKRLTSIYREARTIEEESGSNNLFLTLGLLKWFESDSSSQERLAPLILLPVRLEKSARGGFRILLSGEEPRPNITLLQKLRGDFALETAGLEELPADDAGVDVPRVLATFRDRIKDKDRWQVLDHVHLCLLQFSKFVLWRDLEEHMEGLAESPVVQLLLEGASSALRSEDPLPSASAVDQTVSPGDLLCPLDADSSQIAAIQAANDGRTFVLQGPPGTGKSQTITNLIAHALSEGKRVLFVAEKAAALEVVQSRLEKVGLGEACLAVHSHKAGKREVLEQIKKALHANPLTRPGDWERTLRELTKQRGELNGYVEDLHAEHPCGYSFYRATGELAQLGEGMRIDVKLSDPLRTDPAELDALREAADELQVSVGEVCPIEEHAFFGVELDQWTPTLERQLGEHAAVAVAKARDLMGARGTVTGDDQLLRNPIDGGVSNPSASALEAEVSLARALLDCPGTSRALLEEEGSIGLEARLRALMKSVDAERKASEELGSRWNDSFFELEVNEWVARITKAEGSFFLLRWLSKRGLTKELSEYRQSGSREVDLKAARRDFKRLQEWRVSRDQVGDGHETLIEHMPTAFNDQGEFDLERGQAILSWSQRVREQISLLADEHPGAGALREAFVKFATAGDGARLRSQTAREKLERLAGAYDAFCSARATLVTSLCIDGDQVFGAKSDEGFVEKLVQRADRLSQERDQLRPWTSWLNAVKKARVHGLGAVISALESSQILPEQVTTTVQRSLLSQIAEAALVASPRLQSFSRDSHQRRIEAFRQLDAELLSVSQAMAQAKCRANIPSLASGTTTGETGLLLRETKKQKRHISIRRLFSELPTLLPRIKPCLLMSPISVAQYLSPRWQADLVIFDEASQIPVADAIGALGRGKAAVVVGDSKQLPPTAFFSKASGEDEEEGDTPEDLQSILEECEASGVPSLNLGWHYRSQHETLIAFSNHHYYDNRLHTFPSAAASVEGLGVRHVYLPEAVYDKGKSSTNRGEAEAIIADLVERCRKAEADDTTPSVGIVAFSKAQADLIEDLLDERARTEESLDSARRAPVDPIFVKNLENVQGDERDAILFSICYGPDVAGKTAMNFGPLNRQGGERRLNVAITRARRELVVYSRLRADDIDLRRTQALGAEHLKVFLDYADRGPQAIAESITLTPGADFDSPFEKSVYDALVARGHRLDIQVGCSGYRLDLAVKHPEKEGRYILAIECDGASYHSAATARDRDRLRQGVLENLGWTLHRIWSTDYFANAKKEIDRAEEAIAAALAAPDASVGKEVSDTPAQNLDFTPSTTTGSDQSPAKAHNHPVPDAQDSPEPTALDTAPRELHFAGKIEGLPQAPIAPQVAEDTSSPYTDTPEHQSPYEMYRGTADREIFERNESPAILAMMHSILSIEAPIEATFLHRRTIASFGVARLGSRIKKTLTALHAPLEQRGFQLQDGVFWLSHQDPTTWRKFRTPMDGDTARKLDEIPLAELANSLDHQLQRLFGLPVDDLLREGARPFGINSLGQAVRKRMQKALDHLVASQRAVLDGDQVRLPG